MAGLPHPGAARFAYTDVRKVAKAPPNRLRTDPMSVRPCLVALLANLLLGLSCPCRAADDVPKKDLIKVPIADIPAGAKRALVVGITDYKKARGLGLSSNDAKAFAGMLKSRLG